MAAQETTPQLALIDKLLGQRDHLKAQVRFLRARLEQRQEKTVSHYNKLLLHFKNQRDKEFKIFLELPYNVGLLHEEIRTEYEKRYPNENTKDLPRRTRENVELGRLWAKQEPNSSKVRFYLRLKE